MKRALAVLATMTVGLAGCTMTDSHPDYGRAGYYDQGYAYGTPAPAPGYVAPPPPGYVQPGYAQPGYAPPPRGYYPPPARYEDGRYRDDQVREEYRSRAPVGPQVAPGANVEAVQAGEQLVGAIDRYLQSINRYNEPLANNMKTILAQMRSAADTWRNSAQRGGARPTLQVAANDLLNRFNAANQVYAQMVATNPNRYKSDNFARVASATERVVYSVR
jgi:hypothetical protein